ncbi:hypothetical protein QJS04_geneDACA018819 [Acorus gramineus]|uniref:Uncharacterized protein n=1 Tax=Acorus gramineus TaxID=55184 RepID=A0AAV9BM68_ACOGR|nr:hypothetical protein QJS04_geneDACA018819 [Acorus gramineus]
MDGNGYLVHRKQRFEIDLAHCVSWLGSLVGLTWRDESSGSCCCSKRRESTNSKDAELTSAGGGGLLQLTPRD